MRSPQLALLLSSSVSIAACTPVSRYLLISSHTHERTRGDRSDPADPANQAPAVAATAERATKAQSTKRKPAKSTSGIQAGAADDNLEFNAFLDFLASR